MLGYALVGAAESLIAEEIAGDLGTVRVAGGSGALRRPPRRANDWRGARLPPDPIPPTDLSSSPSTVRRRGRRGNRWLAPAHSSILCSVLTWRPGAGQAGTLTRAAAVTVAEAIRDQCHLPVGIKWPNDLVIEDRKVAGILVESRPEADGAGRRHRYRHQLLGAARISPTISSRRLRAWPEEPVDRTLLAQGI